ncbi:hypothetical protein B0H19DRAFT_1074509 [Mycena capillaripes]|nr:hypothetical protein B0H19DRAFT_1074509 [Mycena capillaripes]
MASDTDSWMPRRGPGYVLRTTSDSQSSFTLGNCEVGSGLNEEGPCGVLEKEMDTSLTFLTKAKASTSPSDFSVNPLAANLIMEDKPSKYHATAEEVPDEDNVSSLTAKSTINLHSLESHPSEQSETDQNDTATCTKAAASDPATQNTAVKDLMAALCADSWGVSEGYTNPKHNPFVPVQLEGMHPFLNLYTDPCSKTYSHQAASASQAAVGFGKGTYWQYSDRHEQSDIVDYRDKNRQGLHPGYKKTPDLHTPLLKGWPPRNGPHLPGKQVISWYHNKCVFYAHDQKPKNWYKIGSSKLHQKGNGHLLMVSDFVSVDFGWSPTSLDDREGYLTCDDVVEQASAFMDILDEVYSEFKHHLVYDNTTTHHKHSDSSLSAYAMPKNSSKSLETNFGAMVNDHNANGKPIYMKASKLKKNHDMEGIFKGTAIILQEQGLVVESVKFEYTVKDRISTGLTSGKKHMTISQHLVALRNLGQAFCSTTATWKLWKVQKLGGGHADEHNTALLDVPGI